LPSALGRYLRARGSADGCVVWRDGDVVPERFQPGLAMSAWPWIINPGGLRLFAPGLADERNGIPAETSAACSRLVPVDPGSKGGWSSAGLARVYDPRLPVSKPYLVLDEGGLR